MASRDEPAEGTLTVYAGPMFSGKSTKLVQTLQDYESYAAFKPATDDRDTGIETHNDTDGIPDTVIIEDMEQGLNKLFEHVEQEQPDAVAIDEAQFFNGTLPATVEQLQQQGYDVIIAGLDKDFRREQFGSIPNLFDDADTAEQLYADCEVCGNDAPYTQRLIDGDPAPYDSPQILIGGKETYEPRCGEHHKVPKKAS